MWFAFGVCLLGYQEQNGIDGMLIAVLFAKKRKTFYSLSILIPAGFRGWVGRLARFPFFKFPLIGQGLKEIYSWGIWFNGRIRITINGEKIG